MNTNLEILSTPSTPYISFDSKVHTLLIRGESRPENTKTFFDPLLQWCKDYYDMLSKKDLTEPITINFTIDVDYMNSASNKCIFDLVSLINKLESIDKVSVDVLWHFDHEDEDSEDVGKEFEQNLNMNFNFVKGGSI